LQTVRHRFNIYASSWAPPTCYTLRRNTASIMKGLVWHLVEKFDFFGIWWNANSQLLVLVVDYRVCNLLIIFEDATATRQCIDLHTIPLCLTMSREAVLN